MYSSALALASLFTAIAGTATSAATLVADASSGQITATEIMSTGGVARTAVRVLTNDRALAFPQASYVDAAAFTRDAAEPEVEIDCHEVKMTPADEVQILRHLSSQPAVAADRCTTWTVRRRATAQ